MILDYNTTELEYECLKLLYYNDSKVTRLFEEIYLKNIGDHSVEIWVEGVSSENWKFNNGFVIFNSSLIDGRRVLKVADIFLTFGDYESMKHSVLYELISLKKTEDMNIYGLIMIWGVDHFKSLFKEDPKLHEELKHLHTELDLAETEANGHRLYVEHDERT